MNTAMAGPARLNYGSQLLTSQPNSPLRFFTKPLISPLPSRTFLSSPSHPPPSSYSSSYISLKVSFSRPPSSCEDPKSHFPEYLNLKTLKPHSINPFSVLKPALLAGITAAALFFCFRIPLKPAIASTVTSVPLLETTNGDKVSIDQVEEAIEEFILAHPHDTLALKDLMDIKVKKRKLGEAIGIVDKLMKLEPDDKEWTLLKSQLQFSNSEFDLARKGYYEVISNDPFCVEAYHGLIGIASSQSDKKEALKELEKQIEDAIAICEAEKKVELREFKLLLAQVRVNEEKYDEALKLYKDLAKEDTEDFRPCLYQGVIYLLLKNENEAEKSFEEFQKLVPEDHPFLEFLDYAMNDPKSVLAKVGQEKTSLGN